MPSLEVTLPDTPQMNRDVRLSGDVTLYSRVHINPKTAAAGSSETSVDVHKSKRHQTPQYSVFSLYPLLLPQGIRETLSLQFLSPKTFGRTPWTVDQSVAKSLPKQDNINTE